MHFNENANCKQTTTKQGEGQYKIVFPKFKKGGYIVRWVVEKPSYGNSAKIAITTCIKCLYIYYTGYIRDLIKETMELYVRGDSTVTA